MLTKDLLFGMNALSLIGFAVMFVALNTARRPDLKKVWSIALMTAVAGFLSSTASIRPRPRTSRI